MIKKKKWRAGKNTFCSSGKPTIRKDWGAATSNEVSKSSKSLSGFSYFGNLL